jgi:hypothetical protein
MFSEFFGDPVKASDVSFGLDGPPRGVQGSGERPQRLHSRFCSEGGNGGMASSSSGEMVGTVSGVSSNLSSTERSILYSDLRFFLVRSFRSFVQCMFDMHVMARPRARQGPEP